MQLFVVLQNLRTREVCERLATVSPVRKKPRMSSNGSEIRTKLLVPAYLNVSEAQYRSHNHCIQPPPNGQKQEEAETISDHPRHPACWVASALCVILFYFVVFYFPGLLPRWGLSAEVHPGRHPPASGQEASSNPILALNGRWSRRRILHIYYIKSWNMDKIMSQYTTRGAITSEKYIR